jgi:tetratricopeptide (TPR) repeat protein
MLSLMADYQLHGLHAGGYHLTNVLLHVASVILLFLILREMTGALWRSAFVAAVFAIHPLRVESVAWVAERKDVLGGFFFMLTLAAYIYYVRKSNSLGRYLMVGAAFVLALLSKPTVVTLPFVLLLLDCWPLQRVESVRRLILEKIPLLALAAGACAMTVLAAEKWIPSNARYSMPLRVSNALVSYVVYLRQMVWPEGLAMPYPYPHNGLPFWEVALAGALLAGLSAVAWRMRRPWPWLLIGWLWYLGMLTPMIGIVQMGAFAHADRNTYLPHIGIYLALTWLVAEWRASRTVFGGLMAGVLVVLMVCAWQQTRYWKNSETLWTHTLACTPDNAVAHINLGNALNQEGRVDEAIIHERAALQIRPTFPEAHYNLGGAIYKKGRVDEAITEYQKALELKPDYAVYYTLGNALRERGRMDEAIVQYQKALQIKPSSGETHNNLGAALRQKGRVDEAIAQYNDALRVMPENASVHVNLANALLQKGRVGEAIGHFQTALKIEPVDIEVQNNLAWQLATCGQASLRNGSQAVQLARQANDLAQGKNPVILGTLAAALAEAGKFGDARRSAQEAIGLAQAAGRLELVRRLTDQLRLYEADRPFHRP